MRNARRVATRIMGRLRQAESEGARREKEIHELQQQYNAPAYDDPRKRDDENRKLEEDYKAPAYEGDRDQEWEYDEETDDPESAAEARYGNALHNAQAMLDKIPGVFDWSERYPESAHTISDFLIRAAKPGASKWLLQLAHKLDALYTAHRDLDKFA